MLSSSDVEGFFVDVCFVFVIVVSLFLSECPFKDLYISLFNKKRRNPATLLSYHPCKKEKLLPREMPDNVMVLMRG